MKILQIGFILMVCALGAQTSYGDITLASSSPPNSPLTMSSGATSAPILVAAVSSSGSDILAAWQFRLIITADAGATGTLSFKDPATPTPNDPTNYIFGNHGIGIAVSNSGDILNANDFDIAGGTSVGTGPGANLLQIDFQASANASGVFGIYAIKGNAFTVWTDSTSTTEFFKNVPNGTGSVLIGSVQVSSAPEPSSLAIGLVCFTLLCTRPRARNWKPSSGQNLHS